MQFLKAISEDIFRIHTHTKEIKSATLPPKRIESFSTSCERTK